MLQYEIIPVTNFQQNCTLLWCDQTNDAVLIDPGGDTELLIAAVERHKLNLKAIWLTHGHVDHIGGSAELKKTFNIPVSGPHFRDEFLFKAIPMQCEMFGFPTVKEFLPDNWFDENQQLSVGKEVLSVIHTPGHTPGHIVLSHESQKLLWVGDVIFRKSIGRTDLPQGNHAQLLTSIRDKLLSLADDYQIFPGHGPDTTIGYEKSHNPFLK